VKVQERDPHPGPLPEGEEGCDTIFRALIGLLLAWVIAPPIAGAAGDILDASGVKGGLVVCAGCDDHDGLVALRRGDGYLVQGLDVDAERVAAARDHIAKAALGDSISVKHWEGQGKFLPYADNLVNLIVMRDAKHEIQDGEIERVLAPRGVAIIHEKNGDLISRISYPASRIPLPASRIGDGFVKFVKPVSSDIDEWTHWLHGPDGNAVARDKRSGPPENVQWIARPKWPKSHDVGISMTGMVTAGGRLFYIADDGPVGILDPDRGLEQWKIFARDAFNGVLLWTKPIDQWGMRVWAQGPEGIPYGPWSINPRMIHRRMVADGNHLYVTPGFDAPVHVLDGATGETVRVFAGTDYASEMVVDGRTLYVTVDLAARKAGKRTKTPEKSIVAVDVDSGEKLWQTDGFVGIRDNRARSYDATLTRMHITSGGGKVYTVETDEIIALDSATGREVWRRDRPEKFITAMANKDHPAARAFDLCSFLYHDGMIYFWQVTQKKNGWASNIYDIHLQAISASDGELSWTKMCAAATFMQSIPRVYIAQGLLWVEEELGERDPGLRSGSIGLLGLDPKTGEEKKRYDNAAIFQVKHHHRCYPNKATENFLIYSRNGLEYVDFRNGEMNINRWLRGICQYGIMPANGLMYSPAQPCSCYPSARYNGFYAYASEVTEDATAKVRHSVTDDIRLLKGPAYDQPIEDTPIDPASEWPVYRHDTQRTGAVATEVPIDLRQCWAVEFNEPVTAPTIAAGRVFMAGHHSRKVYALDADTGRESWSRYVEGLVDTPPTLSGGRVYFGTCDGYVYCLRAADGEIVWRFNANPHHRMIVSFGQLESAWPVHGSVIIKDNVVYFSAGRSSYLDGGIFIYALDAVSGTLLRSTRHDTAGRSPPNEVIGTADDLLIQDGDNLFIKNLRLNVDTFAAQKGNWNKRFVPGPPLSAIGSLLDDSMFDRSAWFIDNNHTDKMIVFNDFFFFAMGWIPNQGTWHDIRYNVGQHQFKVIGQKRGGPTRSRGRRAKTPLPKTPTVLSKTPSVNRATLNGAWQISVPVRISSMVLADDTLFFGGVPDATDSNGLLRSIAGETGGVLMAVAAGDGKGLLKLPLPSPPGWDSMAAARGRLYLSTSKGEVICFAGG